MAVGGACSSETTHETKWETIKPVRFILVFIYLGNILYQNSFGVTSRWAKIFCLEEFFYEISTVLETNKKENKISHLFFL